MNFFSFSFLIKWVKLLVISNHKMLTFSNEHIGISPRESRLPYPPPSATTSPAIVIGFWRRRRDAPAGRRFAPLFRCTGAAMPSLEATCAARARNWVLFSIYLWKCAFFIISVKWWSLQLCQQQLGCPVGGSRKKWGTIYLAGRLLNQTATPVYMDYNKWRSGSICSSRVESNYRRFGEQDRASVSVGLGRHVTWCTKLVRTQHVRFLPPFFLVTS